MQDKGVIWHTLPHRVATESEAILTWFASVFTNDRRLYDLPTHVDFFVQHVRCIALHECGLSEHTLPAQVHSEMPLYIREPWLLDPHGQDAVFLFFLAHPKRKQTIVYGYMLYQDLVVKHNCAIKLKQLCRTSQPFLLISEANMVHESTHASVSIAELDSNAAYSKAADKCWIFFPISAERLPFCPEGHEIPERLPDDGDGGIGDVEIRMNMLRDIYNLHFTLGFSNEAGMFAAMDNMAATVMFAQKPRRDFISWALVCQVAAMQCMPKTLAHQPPVPSKRYETIRQLAEGWYFQWRMNRFFLQHPRGHAYAWIRSICKNLGTSTPGGIHEPEPRDVWHNGAQETVYFSLPYDEYPVDEQMPSPPMPPVYEMGTARVPTRLMPKWLWNQYRKTARLLTNQVLIAYSNRAADYGQDGRLQEHVGVAEHDVDELTRKNNVSVYPSSNGLNGSSNEPNITDMEDLCLAPCMRHTLHKSELKHGHRYSLAVTMRAGGVTADLADAIFLREVISRQRVRASATIRDARSAWWDWTSVWTTSTPGKPAGCPVYIDNARKKIYPSIHCAMYEEGVRETDAACQDACSAQFKQEFPEHYREMRTAVRNPVQWTQWKNSRSAMAATTTKQKEK